MYSTSEEKALTAVEAYPSPKPGTSVELLHRVTYAIDTIGVDEEEDLLEPGEHHYREVPWE